MWRIAALSAGCAVVSAALVWLSRITEGPAAEQAADSQTRSAALSLSGFILLFGIATGLGAVLCAVWLAFRIRDARIPAWEKRGRKKR